MTKFTKQSSIPGSAAQLRRELWTGIAKNRGDNYLERFITHQRPCGTEPVSLAVDYINKLCDSACGGVHKYTLNDLGKWRRNLKFGTGRPPPQKVIDIIRAELIYIALLDISEDYAAKLCEYIGLPQLD